MSTYTDTVVTEPDVAAAPSPPAQGRSGRRRAAIGVAAASVGLAVLGGGAFGAYTLWQNHQEEQAMAAALDAQQAEFDTFMAETEDVWDLFVEMDFSVTNGLTYREHDGLVADITSELARVDADGPMAEGIVDDMIDVLGAYADANNAWNEYIYDDGDQDDKQPYWVEATDGWADVDAAVEDWKTAVENGELLEPFDTV